MSELINAIESGSIERVKLSLSSGLSQAELNEALIRACSISAIQKFSWSNTNAKTAKIIGELICSDKDILKTLTAITNSPEIIKLLLEAGAQVNPPESNWTPLMAASGWGGRIELTKNFSKIDGVYYILSLQYLKDKIFRIREACESQHENFYVIVEDSRLMEDINIIFGDDINILFLSYEPSEESVQAVKILLEAGADSNAQHKYYDNIMTALDIALESHSHSEIIKLLLEAGSEIKNIAPERSMNYQDSLQEKLSIALKYDSPELVHYLLMHRADPEKLIFYAAENCSERVIQELITFGAYIDSRDDSGRTPLIIAAAHNTLSVIKYLLSEGADVNARDKSGVTALIAASDHNHHEVVKTLLESGANPNAKITESKQTALMRAAQYNNLGCSREIIKELVNHGADVKPKDDHHMMTALEMYKDWHSPETWDWEIINLLT
ncbi:MAG: ankyrin repeat domain-containing protein [Synergistaceae bacterium]|nr:ankyrin repeat domain-containing protein [Synergistaceae bacterium]